MQHKKAIFETLFNRNFSDTGNLEFLRDLTGRYPFFSPAQFYLLHTVKDDQAAFEKQAVKTGLFFNNPHWLNFQLNQTSAAVPDEPKRAAPAEHDQLHEQVISDIHTHQTELTVNEPEPEKEMSQMPIAVNIPEQKANLAAEAMLFEPMHMVDYFASQGIKLSEEVQTGDKLGKQLKSFTEWLKTMKKIPVGNEAENTIKTDVSVQILAENSNSGEEVLTEAMAEVYARQGKISKAIEVYQKLSLLNPAKSTYFAAKSENLKV